MSGEGILILTGTVGDSFLLVAKFLKRNDWLLYKVLDLSFLAYSEQHSRYLDSYVFASPYGIFIFYRKMQEKVCMSNSHMYVISRVFRSCHQDE